MLHKMVASIIMIIWFHPSHLDPICHMPATSAHEPRCFHMDRESLGCLIVSNHLIAGVL